MKPGGGVVRGTAVEEIPRPPIQEGRHRSLTAEGGGGGDSASSGGRVASPASTVSRRFNLSWSLFSSNICGFFPLRFSWWWFVDVRTQSAASRCRSVRRVHGAVTSLLLLLLLQEELLQRRRARLHHGARPDGLRGKAEG